MDSDQHIVLPSVQEADITADAAYTHKFFVNKVGDAEAEITEGDDNNNFSINLDTDYAVLIVEQGITTENAGDWTVTHRIYHSGAEVGSASWPLTIVDSCLDSAVRTITYEATKVTTEFKVVALEQSLLSGATLQFNDADRFTTSTVHDLLDPASICPLTITDLDATKVATGE